MCISLTYFCLDKVIARVCIKLDANTQNDMAKLISYVGT